MCAKLWPETSYRLGKCLKNFMTNEPFVIGALNEDGIYLEPNLKMIKEHKFKCLIFSFPTIDLLMDGAKLDLIKKSAQSLKVLVDRFELKGVVIGRPGVGIGGLTWGDVKTEIEPFLDDRFTIVSFEHEE